MSTKSIARPGLALAALTLAGAVALACVPAGRARRGLLPPEDAPGAIALAPLARRGSRCGAESINTGTFRELGLHRSFDVADRPAGRTSWHRRVVLELDSVGRPRRIRAIAGTTWSTTRRALVDDTVEFVGAWIASDGRVERGRVGRSTVFDSSRSHYWSGDPLPTALHEPVARLARAVFKQCVR